MIKALALKWLRFGTWPNGAWIGAGAFALAFASAPFLVSPAFAQGNCPNCDLPPGCRGNGNNKDKSNNGNGNGNGRPDCQRLEITIESDLDFGRLVLLGDGQARVILDLSSGQKTLIGDVDDLGGMPFTGSVIVTGAPFQQVAIDLPSEVDMRGTTGGANSGEAVIRDFVMDADAFSVLDSNGRLEFRFSATLVLGTQQSAAGKLRGRIPISVEYP
jgi:hypothetical protein